MSLKLNTFIDIISTEPVKDSEGFVSKGDVVLASVRAYKEDRHGNVAWRNRAAFSEATALFRFRNVPGIKVTTAMIIACSDGRYTILSVENVKSRNMYWEVLTKRVKPNG